MWDFEVVIKELNMRVIFLLGGIVKGDYKWKFMFIY